MKKTLLSICLLITGFSDTQAQGIWDNFDGPSKVDYIISDGALIRNFTNPQTTGINTSSKCASYTRNPDLYNAVILIDPAGTRTIADVSDYLTNTKKMSMKIFTAAPIGTTIQITLENKAASAGAYPAGRHSEYTAVTTATNQWHVVEFSFSSRPDNTVSNTSVDRMVVLFRPNSWFDDNYLFDDLVGPALIDPCASVTPDYSIINDFECQRTLPFLYTNGILLTRDNPVKTGINPSEKSGYFTKFAPPANDGAFGGDLITPFTTATYDVAKIQLYSTVAAQSFFVIFQDGNGGTLIQKIFETESTNAWQEYVVDLSTIPSATTIQKVVLLLNPGTTSEDFIYLDNFTLQKGMGTNFKKQSEINTAVYPNPTNGLFKIQSNENITSVSVTDQIGRQISTKYNVNFTSADVDITALESGFYYVMINYSNGTSSAHRIVKFK
jgi:hypothetical protein